MSNQLTDLSGDVHSPESFGFDTTKEVDREAWRHITGFTVEEAELIRTLIANGRSQEIAEQTILYERQEQA